MTSRFDELPGLIDRAASEAKAGRYAAARQTLEQAMAHPEAHRYAGRIERGRRWLIRVGAYDGPAWQPHPDFCALCFVGLCAGEHTDV